MKVLITNQQRRRPLNKTKITRSTRRILTILEQPTAELSVLFVGDRKMAGLNNQYRGINKTTDVLSFSQISASHFTLHTSHFILGDIVISVPKAESQAEEAGIGFYDEVRRLLIHGILHLLGHDHEGSYYRARKMRKMEEEIYHAT